MFKTTQKLFILCLTILLPACGTIIGNGIWGDPTTPAVGSNNTTTQPPSGSSDFLGPIQEYATSTLTNCGSFTEHNSASEIDTGRQCIIEADTTCSPSKYLYNKTNTDGTRFVSFVSVINDPNNTGQCLVRVYTVSDVPPNSIDNIKTCSSFTENQIPEVSCNILQQ